MGGLVLAMTLVATYTSASSSWEDGVGIHLRPFPVLDCRGADWRHVPDAGRAGKEICADFQADSGGNHFRLPEGPVSIRGGGGPCGLALVVFFITQMIGQFIGGATLIQTVTGVTYWAGLLLFGAVVVFIYCFWGIPGGGADGYSAGNRDDMRNVFDAVLYHSPMRRHGGTS